MSLHLPSRRFARCATYVGSTKTPFTFLIPCTHRRTLFNFSWGGRKDRDKNKDIKPKAPKNLLTEEYLKKKPKQPELVRGNVSKSSIFYDQEAETTTAGPKAPEPRNPHIMAAALDPKPQSRMLWQRKMVIREIKKRGRLTKGQQLKREERQMLLKSHDFKTSVKKLVPLAKQIAGKTIDEAIIQMRFSKKKVAKDVREHLEHAKNEAIVRRGMGLDRQEGQKFTPVNILTKDKQRVTVNNPTTIYVDQAWCGKGLYTTSPDHRARGQINIMKNRTTSISVVLKEEKTRIRLHNEQIEKEKNKRTWVQLPNRPITAQRQYYSW
ncbi:mitochondrial large ribosomal subunit [Bisporella sp. PMI_857]|nr:mitochondrial large ribosomal subunit [Bisporella sp. PMI_857]